MREFFAKPKRFQDDWNKSAHVVSKMRGNPDLSLRHVASEFDIDPRIVVRLRGPALRKQRNGRYRATASDRLLVVLVIPTPKGLEEIGVRGFTLR